MGEWLYVWYVHVCKFISVFIFYIYVFLSSIFFGLRIFPCVLTLHFKFKKKVSIQCGMRLTKMMLTMLQIHSRIGCAHFPCSHTLMNVVSGKKKLYPNWHTRLFCWLAIILSVPIFGECECESMTTNRLIPFNWPNRDTIAQFLVK